MGTRDGSPKEGLRHALRGAPLIERPFGPRDRVPIPISLTEIRRPKQNSRRCAVCAPAHH